MLILGTMKKAVKIFCWIILVLLVIVFFGIRFVVGQLVNKMPEIIQNTSSSEVKLSVGNVKNGGCLMHICVELEDLSIRHVDYEPIEFKKLYFEIPLMWPIRANIKTPNKNEKWNIDASFGRYIWNIHSFNGRFENLDFSLSGKIDAKKETGELILKTIGLKDFLVEFTDIPSWLALLVQNTPQEFVLKPQEGALRFYGIPIFNFHTLK